SNALKIIEKHGLNNRYALTLKVLMIKFDGEDGGGVQHVAYFNSKCFVPKTVEEVTTGLILAEKEILDRLETYQRNGSGWTVVEYLSTGVTFSSYMPASYGCSDKELP